MQLPAKPLLLAVSAALVVGLPAVPAAARPAARHAVAHAKPTHVKPSHDRLAGPRHAAASMIGAQRRAVALLAAKAATSTDLTDTDRPALQAALATDLAALDADGAAVTTAASATALRTLMRAAQSTRDVALTRFVVVRAADLLTTRGADLTAQLAALDGQLATAAASGTDTTAVQAAVDAATQQLTDALASLPGTVTAILAVAPDASRTALHAAAAAAHGTLESAGTALDAVAAAVSDARTALGL